MLQAPEPIFAFLLQSVQTQEGWRVNKWQYWEGQVRELPL